VVVTRKVFYVAHPVSGDVDGNIKRAFQWLRWLRRQDSRSAYQAPWIAAILSGEDDSDPRARERGLLDCEATAAKCDGIVLVGGRISVGMARERDACIAGGGVVVNLTHLGEEPPTDMVTRGLDELEQRTCDETSGLAHLFDHSEVE
jgi:hypothetical protein